MSSHSLICLQRVQLTREQSMNKSLSKRLSNDRKSYSSPLECKMSSANVRVPRPKNLSDVTNRNFLLRSSRSPLKKDVIGSKSPVLEKRHNSGDRVPDIRTKKTRISGKNVSTMTDLQKPNERTVEREEIPTAQVVIAHLEDVLTDAYCDIPARLKLPSPPKCAFNFQMCCDQHFHQKKIKRNEQNLRIFLDNENPMFFLHMVNTMTARGQFLDNVSLQLMLEMILSVNENCDANGTYSAEGVIGGASLAYSNILNTFPTCLLGAKETYCQLVLRPILRDGFLANDGFDKGESILMNIIERLEQMLLIGSADPDRMLSARNSEDLLDFRRWESNNTQKYKFEQLKRNEKIDRLFLVLHLLIETMEHDLTMWMMCYARKPDGKMARLQNIPLIASVLWSKEEHRQISHVVKRVVKLFVDYVSIDFPEDKIAILSRFINLMYTTLDLCDNKVHEEEIVYPNADDGECSLSGHFCDTVYKHLRESNAYDTKLCTNLIESIQLPSLKLYLISKFVGDLNQRKMMKLHPQSINEMLQQLLRKHNIDHNDDDTDMSVDVDPPLAGDYPFMKLIRKKYSSGISDREYAELLLDALDAYADMHHFVELERKISAGTVPLPFDAETISKSQKKQKLRRFDERYMRTRGYGQALIERELNHAKNTRIYDKREILQQLTLNSVVRMSVGTELHLRYREQIKYYDIVKHVVESGILKHLLSQHSKKAH